MCQGRVWWMVGAWALVGGAALFVSGCSSPGGGGGGGGGGNNGQQDGQGDNGDGQDNGGSLEVLTLETADGNVELSTDARYRPVEIDAPALSATLDWSDDGRTVVARIDSEGIASDSTIAVDLSDAALLEAADTAEEATGDDLSDLRDFIDQNPGLAASVAAGDLSSLPTEKSPDRMQSQDPVTRHLVEIRLHYEDLVAFAVQWVNEQGADPNGVQEPYRSQIFGHFMDLAHVVWTDYRQQVQACNNCQAACRVPCGEQQATGCCCTEDLTPVDTTSDQCTSGYFHEGRECVDVECTVGCCCTDVDGPAGMGFDLEPTEAPAAAEACPSGVTQVGELTFTMTFFPGASCDDTPCNE